MTALRVTVTVQDLEAAIEAVKGMEGREQCRRCVMAQAIHRATGELASCGLSTADAGGRSYVLPDEAGDLINLFDNHAYNELRTLLPVTFELEARS